VVKLRTSPDELILEHAGKSEQEMADNGIVAVADVCNTSLTIDIKSKSSLYFHNLIEVINLYDENLEKQSSHFFSVLDLYKNLARKSTNALTPHAPYSVSAATFRAINDVTANAIISIHNQESEAENQLFQTGKGDFLNLYKELGADKLPITITHKTSLQTWLPYFTKGQTILLVHNTFISEEDIVFAKKHAEQHGLELIYCLCPNANLFIENKLPPVELLVKHQCQIVLGTDSYSSNWQLNLASEIQTIASHFSNLHLEEILKWVTVNGAYVLRQSSLGSIEKGKNPGLVLLETNSLNNELITGRSTRVI
jgi:cytosine/adenosine deaminase-related metal-dependent hydrolase